MNLEKHVSLTACSTIQEITKPLLETLGVGYFAFHRVYHDGKVIRLSTYPEWSKRYISQNYFSKIRLDYSPSLKQAYEYHLWEHYTTYDPEALPVIKESYNDFRLKFGFTVAKQYDAYTDQYILAATENDRIIDSSIYLRRIQYIENFIPYFLKQAQPIIKEAYHTPFLLEGCYPSINPLYFPKGSHDLTSTFDEAFQTKPLARRQKQCLDQLMTGKTTKEIAREVGIAPRTVDHYLELCKKKTGCRNRYELIARFS
jgi:DNA-binding CsgD family transcriptional regulator